MDSDKTDGKTESFPKIGSSLSQKIDNILPAKDNKDKQKISLSVLYTIFAVIVLLASGIYIYNSISSFEDNCNKIYNRHTDYIYSDLSEKPIICNKDSVIIINGNPNELLRLIAYHENKTETLLQLQHQQISNSFTSLTIWSAVLMIIFLVFSLYAMFKADDIQRQARNILEEISNYASQTEEKIQYLDERVNEEIAKISIESIKTLGALKNEQDKLFESYGKASSETLQELRDKQSDMIGKLKQEIDQTKEDFRKLSEEQISEIRKALQLLISQLIGNGGAPE